MISQPIVGATYFLRGLRLMTQPKLRRFVIIPLTVNVLLFAGLLIFGYAQFTALLNWLLPEWLDWLRWLLIPLFGVSVLLIAFFTFSLLANLVAAPFNGLLAEAVEFHLTGQRPSSGGGWAAMLRQLPATLWSETGKLLYFVLLSIPFLVLFLIPGINVAAPFLWLLFSAWSLSLEYVDYPMGNHGIDFKSLRARLRERRMLSLGFGGMVVVATAVPVFNFLVMPAAVAGATALWVDRFKSASTGQAS